MAHILIVDDNDADRKLLRLSLEKDGHVVSEVDDGRYVLEMINKNKPQLIILDLFMPNQEGIETLMQLRKLGSVIPVIVCSCVADTYQDLTLQLGAKGTFQKPIDIKKLVERVSELI